MSYARTRSGTLTGPRPPTARRPTQIPVYDSSGEDEEQRIEAAEEGNGVGNGNGYGSDGAEKTHKGSATLAKSNGNPISVDPVGNGVGKESTEWEELVAKMRDVARRWKRLLDKQGLSMYAPSLSLQAESSSSSALLVD